VVVRVELGSAQAPVVAAGVPLMWVRALEPRDWAMAMAKWG
jgi:hypothetical protein